MLNSFYTTPNKTFNTEGVCVPRLHYMVDTSAMIEQIAREFVEPGKYFVINRARQFGKTTTLQALSNRLKDDYLAIQLSFEGREDYFESSDCFVDGVCYQMSQEMSEENSEAAQLILQKTNAPTPMEDLAARITSMCKYTKRRIVLLIDEVDRATDYQIFTRFLGMLRKAYLERVRFGFDSTFHSVILAGVHDIKNLKAKIRPDSEHAYNSPWNIAAQFDIDMSFSASAIETMLASYEADHHTGMDIRAIAERIYYYTDGYPVLVSMFCKRVDEKRLGWTVGGVDQAMNMILKENNTLFDDMIKNLQIYGEFSKLVEMIVLSGVTVSFNPDNPTINIGTMFGIIKVVDEKIRIANTVFMTRLTNYYTSLSEIAGIVRSHSESERSLFFKGDRLDMDMVLERFQAFMYESYRDRDSAFIESNARLIFTAFLRPIINGQGFCAPEAEIRGARRIDLSIIYGSQREIVELKVWRGEKYQEAGRIQLANYCKSVGQDKGYLVSFCDLKREHPDSGLHEHDGVTINEAVVAFSDNVQGLS